MGGILNVINIKYDSVTIVGELEGEQNGG